MNLRTAMQVLEFPFLAMFVFQIEEESSNGGNFVLTMHRLRRMHFNFAQIVSIQVNRFQQFFLHKLLGRAQLEPYLTTNSDACAFLRIKLTKCHLKKNMVSTYSAGKNDDVVRINPISSTMSCGETDERSYLWNFTAPYKVRCDLIRSYIFSVKFHELLFVSMRFRPVLNFTQLCVAFDCRMIHIGISSSITFFVCCLTQTISPNFCGVRRLTT